MDFFITDLDKTLLKSDLTLSGYTKEIWNGFHLPLSIATARSLTGVKKLLKGLKLNYPMILLDGAMIADIDSKIYKINSLNAKITDEIIDDISRNFGTLPLIVGFDEEMEEKFLYPKKLNPHQKELLKNYKNDKRVLNIEKLKGMKHNLKIVYLGDNELFEVEKHIKKRFDVETKLSLDPYQNCYFLTILHKESDKGRALKVLKEITALDNCKVTSFGDSLNDIGLFRASARAVAVKNALDEVKREAHQILEQTNDEDAVAKYLATL